MNCNFLQWLILTIHWVHSEVCSKTTALTIDIHGRSQTSYTALCNGVVSHGAQIGGPHIFANHTGKNKRKTNAPMIFAHHAAFYVCLSSRSDCSRCSSHTHLTNRGYFDYRKNLKTPNLSPMLESRWHRFWDLLCISMALTHLFCDW